MEDQLEFGVLGPLRVTLGGREVAIAGPRQRTVLAMLLLAPGQVVSVDRLVDVVWDGCPPATARTQIAISVARLRKAFKAMGYDNDVIVTAHPGYLLRTACCRIDSVDFAAAVGQAQVAARDGRANDAEVGYRRALGLWRGPALEGVAGQLVEDEAARLEERRYAAQDEWTALRLELGHHQELIPELHETVLAHPLRERPRGQLMLAQYRAGRRAEALKVFQDGRRQFTEALGIEPGSELRRLQSAILRDDPDLLPRDGVGQADDEHVVPAQLPFPPRIFVGRQEELAALDALLHNGGLHPAGAPVVGWITGAAGSGKTAVAVHWAHHHAVAFPDGQLYADLGGNGGEGEPAHPGDILKGFLSALGVPGDRIPADAGERGALYRSVLSDRRVLLVLDDVRSFRQVRPLLPGGGHCRVLVTGRGRGDDPAAECSAVRVRLGALAEPDAVRLLGELVGEGRIAAEAGQAERLARLCERLPLALRIAAGRLAGKPHWTVAQLAARLFDERSRLDELSQGEVDLRAVLTAGYHRLSQPARVLYRRLGLLATADFAAWAGAALVGTSAGEAERLLEQLVDLQLLTVAGVDADGRTRYTFPFAGLLHPHARECAEAEDGAQERWRALEQVRTAWASHPGEPDPAGRSPHGHGIDRPVCAGGQREPGAIYRPRPPAWRRGAVLRGR
ncbi:BTAD domain-containing putative transcriptional regulator [Streptomyces sp. NPDC001339]|uniref:AfsR/SARP family transcriptional regulator n=1 Tax=Streptomyces sp. NPDC001339 TaxID=3364563 RepID=UPI0036B0084B